MTNLDSMWDRARDDLLIVTEGGERDVLLWEHSSRVARSAQMIAAFPVVQALKPEEIAVVAAGLYHDAGWVDRIRDGEMDRSEIFIRQIGNDHYERGAALMESSLSGLAPEESIGRAANAIRALNDRNATLIEAHVVSDAESLDEFGLSAFWPTIRRGTLDGKGIKAAIDTWHRRREYQFWTARLNDSFRFDAVRELARQRLAKYERAMRDLEEHHDGSDIKAAHVAHSAEGLRKPAPK